MKSIKRWMALCLFPLILLTACGIVKGRQPEEAENQYSKDSGSLAYDLACFEESGLTYDHSMELRYASGFRIDYTVEGYKLVSLSTGDRFLVVPEGKTAPAYFAKDEKTAILKQPLRHLYMVSSSQMDFMDVLGTLDRVSYTGTKPDDWYLPEVKKAMEDGTLLYAGKYSAPDYEMLLAGGCDLAVENTMIYHKPEVKEKIEELDIPVLVEHSSAEPDPLGRLEWIRLYGALFDEEEKADQFFEQEVAMLREISENPENDPANKKKMAYFYVTSRGMVSVRKSGDYIARMIEMAGGQYLFDDLTDDNALSTMNIQMEAFVEKAMDADILIYNSTIDGELHSLSELIKKCPELQNAKAVKEGQVWCTEKNMYQQTTGIARMIAEFRAILSGDPGELHFFYPLEL